MYTGETYSIVPMRLASRKYKRCNRYSIDVPEKEKEAWNDCTIIVGL
jgi:hypothetical protein